MLNLCSHLHRYVFGAGITYWIWLKRMRLRGGVLHVVLLMTRKRSLGWQTLPGGFSRNGIWCWHGIVISVCLLFWLYFYFNFFPSLAAEINVERKKGQKAKSKSSEGRKQLSSVRVIQRNLVYIVGLPLNLADEDVVPLSMCVCHMRMFGWVLQRSTWPFFIFFMQLLQHREYFGQYGKVLKVSMSRTAAGVIQQFPNNTCSV
jgi:hypothetical protein